MNSRSVRNNDDFNIWVTNFTYHHLLYLILDNKKLIRIESYLPTYGNLILSSSWLYNDLGEYLEVLLYSIYSIILLFITYILQYSSPTIILDS